MITQLSARGLKSKPFNESLAAVTIWVGANASGKTERIDACQLAIRAEHPDPKIGGQNAGIMQLANGPTIKVEMDYGDHRIVRNWTTSRTGFSCDNSEPCKDFAALLLNPRDYFGLSSQKQVDYVASLIKSDDPTFTIDGLTAAVKAIKVETPSEASEKAIQQVCERLRKLTATGPLPWLELALAQLKDDLKLANQTKKRMVGVTTGLEQLRAQDAEAATGTGTVERDLRTVRETLAQLQKDGGTVEARVAAAAKARAKRQELESVKAPAGIDEAALCRRRDELLTAIEAERLRLAARPEQTQEVYGRVMGIIAERGAMAGARNGIGEQIVKLRQQLQKEPPNRHTLADELRILERQIQNAADNVGRRLMTTEQLALKISGLHADKRQYTTTYLAVKESIADLHASVKSFMAQDCCPTCKATGGEWKTRWHLEKLVEIESLTGKLKKCESDGMAVKIEIENAEARLTEWRKEDSVLAIWKERRTVVNDGFAKYEAWATTQTQITEQTAEFTRLSQCVERLESQKAEAEKLNSKLQADDQAVAELVKQHDTICLTLRDAATALGAHKSAQDQLRSTPEPESEATLQHEQQQLVAKQTAAREQISGLEARQRDIIAQRGSLRDQMKAAASATETEAEIEVITAAGKLMKQRQAALVAKAFSPLLTLANEFTNGILPGPLQYRDGCLGYESGGTFITSTTMNGAWQALTFVALAAALSQSAPERLVVFDELARFDQPTKRLLIGHVLALIESGAITQFLGNDLDAAAYREFGDRVKIIEV